MREFKFRAWDKVNGRMYDVEFIGKNVIKLKEAEWENRDDFIVMQYTGLKDSEGREIYEGDVIETQRIKGVVKWDNFFGCWQVINKTDRSMLTNIDVIRSEVLGNIYENPELLGGNDNV
ncbi:hypothetical protein ciss_07150 [Carboxydothermus islandicus]|uniref:YopX protein domain-containing protein n=1 Tax=Carboxydothermus islandicus TaxID=661089 RepID=A0A1L8D0U2_9THEO|nr:YopX family protein [Carboxydothermus islandicus]GAV24782.1 hypothetical protein ciss_07150 [Carboxydothermus islandicus]